MTGIPEFNYPAFEAAAASLRAAGYEVVSPHEVADGDEHEWEWYIRKDIAALAQCDAIALLPGHEVSRGSALECHIGSTLGMRILPVSAWLSVVPA